MTGGEVGNVGVGVTDEQGWKGWKVLEFFKGVGEKGVGASGGGCTFMVVGPAVGIDYVESAFGIEGAHGNSYSAGGGGFPVALRANLPSYG